jgi:hypothetical protein
MCRIQLDVGESLIDVVCFAAFVASPRRNLRESGTTFGCGENFLLCKSSTYRCTLT